MRELDGRRLLSRVKGRPALERRLRGLLVAVHRFDRSRAVSRDDRHRTGSAGNPVSGAPKKHERVIAPTGPFED